jgi:starvation-inducible DNA-binding protein
MLTMAVPSIANGLAPLERAEVVDRLSAVFDDVSSLMIWTQVYHWNVEGPLFEPIHNLTQTQYTALFSAIDDLAERIRALDRKPAAKTNRFPTGSLQSSGEPVR